MSEIALHRGKQPVNINEYCYRPIQPSAAVQSEPVRHHSLQPFLHIALIKSTYDPEITYEQFSSHTSSVLGTFWPSHSTSEITESKELPLTVLKGNSLSYSANRHQSLTYIVWVRSVCKQVQQLEIGSIRPFSKLDGKKTKAPCNMVTTNMIPSRQLLQRMF